MFTAYLLCVLAVASAAPHYQWHHNHGPRHHEQQDNEFLRSYLRDDELLDTMRMWKELSDELVKLEDALNDFAKSYPNIGSISEGYVDGKYKITMPLSGFSEQDIVVKARQGLLMVQATHRSTGGMMVNSYLNMRNVPNNVNPSGTWSYENDVLTIILPLFSTPELTTEVVQTTTNIEPTTQDVLEVTSPRAEEQSREEMAPVDKNDDGDADVGVARGDNISNNDVEATTYAVDITNEIDFVPIQYRALNK